MSAPADRDPPPLDKLLNRRMPDPGPRRFALPSAQKSEEPRHLKRTLAICTVAVGAVALLGLTLLEMRQRKDREACEAAPLGQRPAHCNNEQHRGGGSSGSHGSGGSFNSAQSPASQGHGIYGGFGGTGAGHSSGS